jgi:hypothetical protein
MNLIPILWYLQRQNPAAKLEVWLETVKGGVSSDAWMIEWILGC